MESAKNKVSNEPLQDNKRRGTTPENLDLEFLPERGKKPAPAAPTPAQNSGAWRQELSERVLSFRQRRAQMRNETPEEENLDFEFGRDDAGDGLEKGAENFLEFPQNAGSFDAEIAQREGLESNLEFSNAEAPPEPEAAFESSGPARSEAEEIADEPAPLADDRLQDVVWPSGTDAADASAQTEPQTFRVAPIGQRFLAGLADGLVLLIAGALFAVIFWKAGGHLTPVAPNLAIVGLVAVFFVGAYFALFTTVTFSTPGQTWMGMEVRNMEGWPPAPKESFLRAFGYLVSAAALMIGFFWAVADSDGLTWHDRISGTFLTPVIGEAPENNEAST